MSITKIAGTGVKFTLVILMLCCGLFLNAQTLDFKNYTTKEGLITDEVYNLHQDRQGYIWVFSPNGTLKYNGTQFVPVLLNLPFKDSFIYSIYENAQGRKWVANSNGKIYELRNDSAFILKGIEMVSDYLKSTVSEISQLVVDDSSNVYAITKGHSFKFKYKNHQYFPQDLSKVHKADSIHLSLIEIGSNILPVTNLYDDKIEFALFRSKSQRYFQDPGLNLFKVPDWPLHLPMRQFKKLGNTIYFAYSHQLGRLTKDNSLSYINLPSLIINYTRDKNNHLWVSCLNDGIFEINENDSVINHFFEHNTINDVLLDSHGGLWATSPGLGLFHCENINNRGFKQSEPLSIPVSFIKIIDKELFVANYIGDVFKLSNDKWTSLRKADNKTPLSILKQKDLFIITLPVFVEKFYYSNNKKQGFRSEKIEKYYNVLPVSDDTLIYVWRRGLTFYVKGEAKKQIDFGCKILTSELINNEIWLGTESGVYRHQTNFTTESKKINGTLLPDKEHLIPGNELVLLKNAIVVKIVKDNYDNIWFCTKGDGLFKLQAGKLSSYNVAGGLPSDILRSISFADSNSVYLSTFKGLFKAKMVSGDILNTSWENIYSGEVQEAVPFGKNVYLATNKGLIIINPNMEKYEEVKVFFNLAGIYVDNREMNKLNFNSINSRQKSLEFVYDVISFGNVKPALKYKLIGFEGDSGKVTNSVVKFNGLAPGQYTLVAFPEIEKGENLKIATAFEITPMYWQTLWFKVLTVFLLLTIISIIVWAIINYKQRKEALKIKNEQLVLEYKLIALKAQINPHFMSNCLSAIQNLIVNNKTERATFYIARFGLMVRQILDYSSKSLISLNDELELLNIYLELEQLRFDKKFVYEVNIKDEINPNETFIPPLLLNPIVENAIWHGLLPIQSLRQAKLSIVVKKQNDCLTVVIEDNGAGRSFNKDFGNTKKANSYGVKITEQRLSNINYLYNSTEASIIYTDIKNENGESLGTRVLIQLPGSINPIDL